MTRPDTNTKLATEVSAMFDEVSPKYDLINDVLSVGNSRVWRISMTRALLPRKGMRVLDLAAGTGTSSAAIAGHGATVVAADFSEGMLSQGRQRHGDNDLIEFVWADATDLPFEDDSFDAATISFGLRNVGDPKQAIAEMYRVVKPGGRVVICEFSHPESKAVAVPYSLYARHVLPRIAGAISGSADAYRYLNESIEAWPAQEELARWMRTAGFERVAYRNLTFGIVALHRGTVPRGVDQTVEAVPEVTPAATPSSPNETKASSKKPAASKPAAAARKPATVAKKSAPAAKKSAPGAGKPVARAKSPATTKPAVTKPVTAPKQQPSKPQAEKKPAPKQQTATKPKEGDA